MRVEREVKGPVVRILGACLVVLAGLICVPAMAFAQASFADPPCNQSSAKVAPYNAGIQTGDCLDPGTYDVWIGFYSAIPNKSDDPKKADPTHPLHPWHWFTNERIVVKANHSYLIAMGPDTYVDGRVRVTDNEGALASFSPPPGGQGCWYYKNEDDANQRAYRITLCLVAGPGANAPPCSIGSFELGPNGAEMAGPSVTPGKYQLYKKVKGAAAWMVSKPFDLSGGHRYLINAAAGLTEDGGAAGVQADPAFTTPYSKALPDEAIVHYQNTDMTAWIELTICPAAGSAGSAPPCSIGAFELGPNGSEMAGPAVAPGKYRLYKKVKGTMNWLASKPFELNGGHRYLINAASGLTEDGGAAGVQVDPAFATPYSKALPSEAIVHYQNTDMTDWISVTVCPDTGPFKPTPTGTVIDIKKGKAGCLDLIFVIDLTSSMSDDIDMVKKTAKQILNTISSGFPDFRVAIVGYRDWTDSEMFTDFPFSNSIGAITAAIDGLKVQGGGDEPEAVLEALLRAIRTETVGAWRDGCNKQIILMGDAPPHSPVPKGPDAGKTADDVVDAAEKVDPAVINSILIAKSPGSYSEEARKAFESLSARTKGTTTTADKAEEVPAKMMDMVETIKKSIPGGAAPVGGGGGGMVLPSTGASTPLIIALAVLGVCLLLAIAILAIRRRGAVPASGPRVDAALNVTYADGGTKVFRITTGRTTIGRGPANHLVLHDSEVSTNHAEILASSEGFLLRDLGSANGTTLNGQPVTEAYLNSGDKIGMGTTRIAFGA